MAKTASFVCSACQAPSLRWVGRCPRCQEFGSMVEQATDAAPSTGTRTKRTASSRVRPAAPISTVTSRRTPRVTTGATEFDRVLGGGLVAGQVVLVAGEPGVGKSTLLLDVAHRFSVRDPAAIVLYVSAEESAEQIGVRAARIGAVTENLLVADETDLGAVLAHIEEHNPALVVVDSVQTLASPDVDGRAGGISQVSEVAAVLTRQAKARGVPTLLVGQSTRENSIAGPRALEHLVDTVLTFEGDPHTQVRLLRAVKNRYGPADEVVCYEQTDHGLSELADPSRLFRSVRDEPVAGTCATVTLEGRRPLSAEIQSLLSPRAGDQDSGRRIVSGLDSARVSMLAALTQREAAIAFGRADLYVATVAGLRITDPAADLATCLAIYSAGTGLVIPPEIVALGEVALSGDLRPCHSMAQRLAEAARLGFTVALVPDSADVTDSPVRVVRLRRLEHAMAAVDTSRTIRV
ncbi:MAG: DNA repair protein RadA [Candidatus Nanopelagicales bacterium]